MTPLATKKSCNLTTPLAGKNFTLTDWEEYLESIGEKRFRGQQIFGWIYRQRVKDFAAMSNLSDSLREKLSSMVKLTALELIREEISSDGTRKYLFRTEDGHFIESVLIFNRDRVTACLSSQIGCRLGCQFCLTGQGGFTRNLEAGEIVEQFLQMEEVYGAPITNVVFMGMGEPLNNYDNLVRSIRILINDKGIVFPLRRITVSTAGVIPGIKRLGEEDFKVNLAVSLNAADDKTRSKLMPINKKYSMKELIETALAYPGSRRKWVVFEYILIKDINDRAEDAEKLVRLIGKGQAKINLLTFNPYPGNPLEEPEPERVRAFQEILLNHQITTLLRKSKGADIHAACGQLRAVEQEKR
jgi:23S rRNA (adenine2503-C2)-methyltransferase